MLKLFLITLLAAAFPSTDPLDQSIRTIHSSLEGDEVPYEKPWGTIEQVCTDVGDGIAKNKTGLTRKELENLPYADYFVKFPEQYELFIYFNSTSPRFAKYLFHSGLVHAKMWTSIDTSNSKTEGGIEGLIDRYIDWISAQHAKPLNIANDSLYIRLGYEEFSAAEGSVESFCKKIPLIDCNNSSLYRLTRIVSQAQNNVPITPEMVRFYIEPRYVQHLKSVLPRLLEKAKGALRGATIQGNIFDDLVSFLTDQSVDKAEAEEFAWHYLGMYGTRGATFLTDGFQANPFHDLSLHILSLVISYLDKVKQEQLGMSYAFPEQYVTKCIYGKPYHFWMAGYIAKYGLRQQYSSLISFSASAFLGMTYDLVATYNGRAPMAIFTKPLYGIENNSSRIDSAWRILGAFYGVKYHKLKAHNPVDPLIERAFSQAKKPNSPSDPVKPQEMILGWTYVIAPHQVVGNLWRLH